MTTILDDIQGASVSVVGSVLRYSRVDLVVLYQIDINTEGGCWQVAKRFKDFKLFHQELQDEKNRKWSLFGCGLPNLPSQGIFTSTNQSKKLIESRRQHLHEYIQKLLEISLDDPVAAAQLDIFLKPIERTNDVYPSINTIVSHTAWDITQLEPDLSPTVLPSLPWASHEYNTMTGHCYRIAATRGEHFSTVRSRFLEFQNFCNWIRDMNDRVPNTREVLWYIVKYRDQVNHHEVKSSLRDSLLNIRRSRSFKIGTPPVRKLPESFPVDWEIDTDAATLGWQFGDVNVTVTEPDEPAAVRTPVGRSDGWLLTSLDSELQKAESDVHTPVRGSPPDRAEANSDSDSESIGSSTSISSASSLGSRSTRSSGSRSRRHRQCSHSPDNLFTTSKSTAIPFTPSTSFAGFC